MSLKTTVLPERLYSLDALRGIAALSVVLWHWQHFFYVGASPQGFDVARQPLFSMFTLFYTHGAQAVELFFCISGFVFFWLFSEKISSKNMSITDFFVDRFSRLYPLHIVTFLIVAALQYSYLLNHPFYFVYQFNDYYHALLNIFLAPAWGFEQGFSFNGPVWSVSIEILLYAIFFMICLTRRLRFLLVPAFIVLGVCMYPGMPKLTVGLATFFSGGAAFLLLGLSLKYLKPKKTFLLMLAVALSVWGYVLQGTPPTVFLVTALAFPASIAALVSLELCKPRFAKPLAFLGDLSYSSYLVHFPLQIVFAMTFDSLGFERPVFYSVWMLVLFSAVLIPLSFLSHKMLEVPSQRYIRRLYRRRRSQQLNTAD